MAVVKRSALPFSETVARLLEAISTSGNTVFAMIDQSAAAATAGSSLRPTTLIVFGNPKGGTVLMDAYPLVALDLPLKLLVWEENGVVSVAYAPAKETAERFGVAGKEAVFSAMERALDTISDAIVPAAAR